MEEGEDDELDKTVLMRRNKVSRPSMEEKKVEEKRQEQKNAEHLVMLKRLALEYSLKEIAEFYQLGKVS